MNFPYTHQNHEGLRRAVWRPAAALLAVAMTVCGCSSLGSSSQGTTSASSGSVPFGDRISSLFRGGSSQSTAAAESAAAATPTADDIECPKMDIRQGASTLLINGSSTAGDALALRYQGTFVRAARECRVQNGQLNIKIGVEGRVILGPAGAPGELTVPLRLALVQEKLNESKPIWSKFYPVHVVIPPQAPNVNFTHISEDLTIPLPGAEALDQMMIYIGFDPTSAEAEKKRKPAPKAAARPRRAGQ
jgi:hypothetical protein